MGSEKTKDRTSGKSASSRINFPILLLGLYHLFMALIFTYMLIKIWPELEISGKFDLSGSINIFKIPLEIGSEARLLFIVMISAALGSYVHASTSFVSYVGNKSITMSWAWWYILRPFIGMALALIFYFVIRGGLLSTGTSANEISLYGIAAVAGLVGMFSKQATDKLGELFTTLFNTKAGEGDDARKDKLGAKISVNEKMIPLNKMTVYPFPNNASTANLKLHELYSLINKTVTRVPIINDDHILEYIVHESIIYKFISEESIRTSLQGKSFDVNSLTLNDFLNHSGITELVRDAIAFVPRDATILNAKDEMEQVKNCQDVFVTESGKRDGKIIGWLTNVDIGKCLTP